jgi:hypothetical protein
LDWASAGTPPPWWEIEQVPIASMPVCRNFAQISHPNVERLCRRIVEAWEAAESDPKPCPDVGACPSAHLDHLGYLLVDFGDAQTPAVDRMLPSRALVALLSAPRLLPPRFTGGLLIRGAVFERPLVFEGVRLTTPLTLAESRIGHGVVHRPFTGRNPDGDEEAWQDGPGGISLNIRASVFDGALTLGEGTVVEGRVKIANSKFVQLLFREAEVKGELELWRVETGLLGLYKTHFETGLYAVDNLAEAVQISKATFNGNVVLNSNRIDGRFWFGRTTFAEKVASVTIADNGVRGPFTFKSNTAHPGLQKLDLSYNRLDAMAEFTPPKLAQPDGSTASGPDGKRWSGPVTMTGLVVQAELRLEGHGRGDEKAHECGSLQRPVAPSHESVVFDLTAADVRVMSWQQGVACNLRWLGRGFRYELFDPAPDDKFEASGSPDDTEHARNRDPLGALEAWRQAFVASNGDRVDALTYLSEYLQGQGFRAKARDMLEAAKGADYNAWAEESPINAGIASALSLGGYGAKPENAAFLLFCLWALGVAVYAGYSWVHRGLYGWNKLPEREKDRSVRYATPKRPLPRGWWYISFNTSDESTYPGFLLIDKELNPHRMTPWQYSLDAIIPIISLHAYDRFYPACNVIRLFALLQHVVGIGLWGVFIATAAIL